jgi:hypothetical protein
MSLKRTTQALIRQAKRHKAIRPYGDPRRSEIAASFRKNRKEMGNKAFREHSLKVAKRRES